MRRPEPPAAEHQALKAIAHPLRRRILHAMNERVCSPKEVADELGEPLGRVSHHVRVLARLGAIEPVKTRQRRGAVEHFYRATMPAGIEDGETVAPRTTSQALPVQDLDAMIADVRAAMAVGGFDDPRAHVSYTLLDLEDERLDAVARIVDDARQRLSDVSAAAAGRLAQSGEDPILAQVAILQFRRA